MAVPGSSHCSLGCRAYCSSTHKVPPVRGDAATERLRRERALAARYLALQHPTGTRSTPRGIATSSSSTDLSAPCHNRKSALPRRSGPAGRRGCCLPSGRSLTAARRFSWRGVLAGPSPPRLPLRVGRVVFSLRPPRLLPAVANPPDPRHRFRLWPGTNAVRAIRAADPRVPRSRGHADGCVHAFHCSWLSLHRSQRIGPDGAVTVKKKGRTDVPPSLEYRLTPVERR